MLTGALPGKLSDAIEDLFVFLVPHAWVARSLDETKRA